jgi:hypothetical protein
MRFKADACHGGLGLAAKADVFFPLASTHFGRAVARNNRNITAAAVRQDATVYEDDASPT